MRRALALTLMALVLAACGGAARVGEYKGSFSIETEAGTAVCVLYVEGGGQNAEIACIWPEIEGR